jgi:hypothetical protein
MERIIDEASIGGVDEGKEGMEEKEEEEEEEAIYIHTCPVP